MRAAFGVHPGTVGTEVALDVGTGNITGALRLYQSAGFHVEDQAGQWRFAASAGVRQPPPAEASGSRPRLRRQAAAPG